MDKIYHPKSIENKWYTQWEQSGCFAPSKTGQPYCIMIPPPNVTGSLHMGHAFQDTIMDALIRFHRMQGRKTLWQVGTDHAGIATQMVVERQLLQKNISRHDLGRGTFLERVWQWKAESGGTITQQLRRLGASVDWSRERFTMDPGLSQAVQKVFIQLYRENLIYRGKRLVNWDPVLHTAVSDLEVISEEEKGHLWHIRYPLVGGKESLVIATTRPETLLGDEAVAVHPEDPRYQHLIGSSIQLPLCDRTIPIVADAYVDPAFGTGCVKITPAHDFNDYEVGQRHQLPLRNILTSDGKINEEAPLAYRGLDRFKARDKVLADLQSLGLLVKTEDHVLKVPRGDRTGVVIEPYLTDQWFVKVESLAKPAIEAVESGRIQFIPENWSKTYFDWMNKIQDWCISRQLWWGHRIPAWYDEAGNVYVGEDEADVRAHYRLESHTALKQDEDVLDTWFSSALWPFSTLGWPEKTEELKQFYPTQVLVTGFDIIFFWVARMIMFGLKFAGEVPFHEVYIHGLVQDQDGQKMSKSKGNILDPIDLIDGIDLEALVAKRTSGLMQPQMAERIEKNTRKQFPDGIPAYGTDALRFTFLSLASMGRFIRFDLGRIEGYRNFCNKLWNAARYVMMNIEGKTTAPPNGVVIEKTHSVVDRWILSRWQHTKQKVVECFNQYRFDLAAQSVYEFVWNEYCDWYLEFSKPILMKPEHCEGEARVRAVEAAKGSRETLLKVLEEVLRVLHPMMPFVTEEIWQRVAPLAQQEGVGSLSQPLPQTLMMHQYPTVEEVWISPESEEAVQWMKDVILAIRNIRGEMNVAPNRMLSVNVENVSEQERRWLMDHLPFLQALAKIEEIKVLTGSEQSSPSATALVGEMKILIPMKGLIDVDQESNRLKKEIEKLKKEWQKSKTKLDNPSYVEKAPAPVVLEERRRLTELETAMQKLEISLRALEDLRV